MKYANLPGSGLPNSPFSRDWTQGPPIVGPRPEAPEDAPEAAAPQGTGLWDPGNRHKTLLAIGTGLLSGRDFFSGMGQAGQNVLGLSDQLTKANATSTEIGGPDNAFEITTDPKTRKKTYKPIDVFQDYAKDKREKPKDVADITGRAMYAVRQLPEADRPAAYQHMRENPGLYNLDPSWLPPEYDAKYVNTRAAMGSTVSQSRTRDTADETAEFQRGNATRRTDIYERRSGDLTRQGDARIGQGERRLNKAPPSARRGSGKASSGGEYETRIGPNGQIQRRRKR